MRLSYAYATTIDAGQGSTATEHIDALVSGSAATHLNKGYTAESRHRTATWLVVSEAAERQEIMGRVPRGAPLPVINHDVVWENAADNFAREPTKGLATQFIERATNLFYGSTAALQRGSVATEPVRRAAAERWRSPEPELAPSPEPPVDRWENAPDPVDAFDPVIDSASVESTPEPPPDRWAGAPDTVEYMSDGPDYASARPDHAPIAPEPQVDKKPEKSGSVARRTAQPKTEAELQAEFAAELQRIGIRLNGPPILDGQKHMVAVDGNRGSKKSGFYRAERDHGFGHNSKTGESVKWHAERGATAPRSAAQQEADRQARAARQAAQERAYAAAATQAKAIWERAVPARPDHPYLVKKGIEPHGARQAIRGQVAEFPKDSAPAIRVPIAGRLVLPLRDPAGDIQNVQLIGPDGSKLFLAGRKRGLSFQIGEPSGPDQPIIVDEGFATGGTLRQLTGLAITVAIDAGNLLPVAEAIRAAEPARPILIAGDNDHAAPLRTPPLPNVGVLKATEAAQVVSGLAMIPPFAAGNPRTDWNDLTAQLGPVKARAELDMAADGVALPAMPSWPDISQGQQAGRRDGTERTDASDLRAGRPASKYQIDKASQAINQTLIVEKQQARTQDQTQHKAQERSDPAPQIKQQPGIGYSRQDWSHDYDLER
jgi:phage/plasmid primase-like uncharacterized protein